MTIQEVLQSMASTTKSKLDEKADKATTLSGYGITDAASSSQGDKADSAVQTVQINGVEQTKTNGVINLPAYPTTLPASDVSDWAKESTKPSYTASEVGAIATTAINVANGVAGLDESGIIPSSILPSYVDDVVEYASKEAFPAEGESGKVYVAIDKNVTYRWSGTEYVAIGSDLALGETSSTAYAGDKGKAVTDLVGNTTMGTTATTVTGAISEINISLSDKLGIVNVDSKPSTFGKNIYIIPLKTITVNENFATGSLTDMKTMLDLHYAGKLDITDYWNVGDTRSIDLSAMAATGVGESHDAQTVEFVIVGMNHDDLVTPINGKSKAAVTIHMKNCLNKEGYMNSAYSPYTMSQYSTSARRTWVNNTFENALPTDLKNLIKPVTKQTCEGIESGNSALVSSTERCFLLSNYEIFGSAYESYCTEADGVQYDYYKTQANRIKQANGSNSYWWSRSGFWDASYSVASFVRCRFGGTQYSYDASSAGGLAVGLAL